METICITCLTTLSILFLASHLPKLGVVIVVRSLSNLRSNLETFKAGFYKMLRNINLKAEHLFVIKNTCIMITFLEVD